LRKTRSNSHLRDPKEAHHVLEVVEEVLDVSTRQVERGRMRIYSKVTEREVERHIGLRDETIRVQRRAVSRPVSTSDPTIFTERSFEMTEIDEEAMVTKLARVIEEVVVSKEATEKIDTIRETLRRTDVEVEEVAGVRAFDEYLGDFRGDYTQRLASGGLAYERYSPAFRYGYSLASNEPFRSQSWSTIESDARRLWEEKNPGTWEQVKDAIRFSWEKVRSASQPRWVCLGLGGAGSRRPTRTHPEPLLSIALSCALK
jgi:uncharacterized protein (TIGR02271 family)